jgi:hypothetical protein
VREHLGIHSFGVNAFTPAEDGTLISEHDEAGSGQEELYIVLDGKATFEVDGEVVEAPPGTLVYVGPEARRKATGDGTVLARRRHTRRGVPGRRLGRRLAVPRRVHDRYGEERYADALSASAQPSSTCRTTRA